MAHRRGGFAKKIDTVHWTLGIMRANQLAAGSVGQTLLGAQHLPETLLRMRGEVVGAMSGPLTPDTGVVIAMGIILVPEGTGTTVLWDPLNDGDAPWIWWDAFNLIYQEYVTDVIATNNVADRSRVIDSKAMRKVRNTELQFVAVNSTLSGMSAATVEVAGLVRVLAGS